MLCYLKLVPEDFSTYDIYRQSVAKYRAHSLTLQGVCCAF